MVRNGRKRQAEPGSLFHPRGLRKEDRSIAAADAVAQSVFRRLRTVFRRPSPSGSRSGIRAKGRDELRFWASPVVPTLASKHIGIKTYSPTDSDIPAIRSYMRRVV